jgi:hypothetical protein
MADSGHASAFYGYSTVVDSVAVAASKQFRSDFEKSFQETINVQIQTTSALAPHTVPPGLLSIQKTPLNTRRSSKRYFFTDCRQIPVVRQNAIRRQNEPDS